MAYAITQTCCTDASCVSVCPVNCIHPTPEERAFGSTEMLHIDPQACIDCGACADACPVDAIFPIDELRGPNRVYAELNAGYYGDSAAGSPPDPEWGPPQFPRTLPAELAAPQVAIVGSGPAALYAAQALLRWTSAEVTLLDRHPVPGGLIRHGVAPDHPSTKRIGDSFASLYRHPRLRLLTNVEVGTHVSHAELTAHHHAVIYATGAAKDKTLGMPGEELPGSLSAVTFVRWYNGDPTVPAETVDLSTERAVVVGTGNVAVDVARLLASDLNALAGTDIADHALDALRASKVRDIVLLARRGPDQAAYSRGEFLALRHLPGVQLVVDDQPGVRDAIAQAKPGSAEALLDGLPIEYVDLATAPPSGRRIVLRFFATPTELVGPERVRAVRVTAPAGEQQTISTGLVLRSVGSRVAALPELPFDAAAGHVPHRAGHVVDPATGAPVPACYVVGWAKRGASGGIGANRTCAAETVTTLLDDLTEQLADGPLPRVGSARAFARLVRRRQPDALGRREVLAIDRWERDRGQQAGRPRVKLVTVPGLVAAGRSRPAGSG